MTINSNQPINIISQRRNGKEKRISFLQRTGRTNVWNNFEKYVRQNREYIYVTINEYICYSQSHSIDGAWAKATRSKKHITEFYNP